MKACILYATLILAVAAQTTVGPAVTIKNLRLFYGQDEYFIKGVTYSPTPMAKQIEHQTDGTGYCTPHKFVIPGQFTTSTISPCYYDDYTDATSYTNGPSGGMTALWQRDFPLIKQMGVNTIRTYHAHPVTQQSILSDARYTDKTIQGSNHVPFFDMAQQYGFKVVFPLFADQSDLTALSSDFIRLYITTLIDEVGWHPALLMFTFGNELQFFSEPQSFFDMINGHIDFARTYQMQKWNRAVPFTTALIDYPPYYNQMAADLHVELIMSNAGYRGFTFTDLWSGSSQQRGWKTLSCESGKPMLIGEMGVHSNTPVFDVQSWFPGMFQDIINHKNQGAIGGFLFAFSEEHWKGVAYYGQDYTQFPDVYMGVVRLTPGTGQFPVDNVVKKYGGAYDFDYATNGFAENQWAQDGPNKLSTVPNNFCSGSTASTTTQGNTVSSGVCVQGSCAANYCSCGQACYNPSQYCCANGQLQQAQFCTYAPASSTTAKNNVASTTSQNNVASTTSQNNNAATSTSGTTQCQTMFASLPCTTSSEDETKVDPTQVKNAMDWLCGNYPQFCTEVNTGRWTGCNSVEKASYAMSQYYNANSASGASACSFGGLGHLTATSSTTTSQNNNAASTTSQKNNAASTTSQNNNAASTTQSKTTATSSSNTCVQGGCGVGLCSCGAACYTTSQYCCPNGQLTQKQFC